MTITYQVFYMLTAWIFQDLDLLTYGKRQNEMFDLFLFLSFAAIKSLFIMPFIICGKLRMNSKVNHFCHVFSFQDQYLQNNAKLHD